MTQYLQLIEILQIISIDNKPIIENGSILQMFKLQFGHQKASKLKKRDLKKNTLVGCEK